MHKETKLPQTNGIVGRLHKTMLNEFYRAAFRKKISASVDALQTDLSAWLDSTTTSANIRVDGVTARRPRGMSFLKISNAICLCNIAPMACCDAKWCAAGASADRSHCSFCSA
jgi:hypothetical protein